ncbi:MAG: FG-GAP-like repeat-containing protein [Chryseolinea sp.]
MKSIQFNIFKIAGFLVIALLCSHLAMAQRPIIREVNKVSGNMTEVVTLKGSNFGTNAANLSVFFGATKASIQFVTDQLMEVNIPAGTTYQYVSVTNIILGLTGYSRESFLLSFSGALGFNPANLQGQFDFPAESGLYDICMGDFDGDKKVDIAAANDNATFLDIIPNTSSGVGNVNFGKIQIALGARSLHITCGDLNGDGKLDIVASEAGTGDRVFILQNTSAGTGSFTFVQTEIKLIGKKTKRVEIADLDLDGKPELIITDVKNNNVIVLPNISTLGLIAFNPVPLIITIPGAASTDGLAIGDLNGDFRPEIVTSQFITGTSNLYILENKSTPGNFNLGSVITKSISGTVVNIRMGDLDFDGMKDIAVTQLLNAAISIFLNKSTLTSIALANPVPVATEDRPWGLDFGDLDGDGKTDIVVASVNTKTLTILNNTSATGSLSFTKSIAPTTFINRHTKIGDVDGDGKPDIAFTSIDDNNLGIPASKVSIFRNSTCMTPEVTPTGPITVCTGTPLALFATVSRGTTYEWHKDGAFLSSGTSAFLNVTVGGVYDVTAIAEGGSCSIPSNKVTVFVAGPGGPVATASSNTPICVGPGNTLQLSVTNVGATQYTWTGPDNYTGTGTSPAPVTNFQLKNAGRYFVDVIFGSCISQQTSTLVEANDVPEFTVSPGSQVICQGSNVSLSVSPTPPGFTYQWFEKTSGIIAGAVTSSYMTSANGSYFAKATPSSPGCLAVNSDTVMITVVTKPVVNFTAPLTACAGQNVQFTDQSTIDGQATAFYAWNFSDPPTSTDKNPIHNFINANLYSVSLTVSYQGNSCAVMKSQDITITPATPAVITNPDGKYKFCKGESVVLEVGTFSTYLWSTGSTDPTITFEASKTDTVTVEVKATNGCVLNDEQIISVFVAPDLNLSATPELINEGETSQLSASGLNTYTWSPAETLSNAGIANPVATPDITTVYTVTGSDANCTYEGTVTVNVVGEAIVSKLIPGIFFSPNGDADNPVWIVSGIDQYPQCRITIYDDKGVKVFDSKPYLNNWDGTFNGNGKPLPDGAYQYIIRCDGEENKPRKGTITILR